MKRHQCGCLLLLSYSLGAKPHASKTAGCICHVMKLGLLLFRAGVCAGHAREVPALYERVYATVDEPNQAMACLLRGKEAFAAAAFRTALRGVLNLDELLSVAGGS